VRTILAAMAFLTRIPVGGAADAPASLGAAAFGLVGAGIGLLGAIPLLLVGGPAPLLAAVLAIALVALVSGGLHLDGLADTADALAAHGGERAERARRDPAIGAAGAVAVVIVLLLEVAGLAQVVAEGGAGALDGAVAAAVVLVVAAGWGRAVAVGLAVFARPPAGSAGLGAGFAAAIRPPDELLAAAVPIAIWVVASVIAGSAALAAGMGAGLAAGALLAAGVVRARGSLDGDALGAAVELAEAAVIAAGAIALSLACPAAGRG
jgi:adenosylcobinamide-GDP ribazoletransferase